MKLKFEVECEEEDASEMQMYLRACVEHKQKELARRKPHEFVGNETLCGLCGSSINSTGLHVK